MAVELAKASLWLDAFTFGMPLTFLDHHLRFGNALLGATFEAGSAGFDCVVSNPPYGGVLDRETKKALVRLLPLMKANSDTTIGFIEQATRIVSATGRIGLVVPKPLTYSFAWKHVRAFLDRRLTHLVDVSRAWKEVLLEQVIVVYGRKTDSPHYSCSRSNAGGILPHLSMPWSLAERFETFPCALSETEIHWLQTLMPARTFVGDVCKTCRGLRRPASPRLNWQHSRHRRS